MLAVGIHLDEIFVAIFKSEFISRLESATVSEVNWKNDAADTGLQRNLLGVVPGSVIDDKNIESIRQKLQELTESLGKTPLFIIGGNADNGVRPGRAMLPGGVARTG